MLRLVLGGLFWLTARKGRWVGSEGYGFTGTMGFFTGVLHIPAAFLALCAEFLGGIGLIVGALAPIASFGVVSVMAVAFLMVHTHVGWFVN